MAETHELRLKIDAAAAKRGSREFTAAINAVKLAVRDLERDSSGAFLKLRKNMDEIAKRGKMKVGGVDRQAIRDLDSFARAQQKIVTSTQASTKGIKNLVSTMRGLSDSYAMARKTSEAFAASILKTNSALNRQIQLASQARSAVRQVRTAPTATGAGLDPKMAGASSKAVRELNAEFTKLRKTAATASAGLAKAFKDIESGARKSAAETKRANAEVARMENLQLSSAAAIRRAEQEAVRLSARLKQIGDTKGATAVNQSLIKLKANLAGGVGSALELRKAMDQFSQTTSRAKVSITRFNATQTAAAAEARRMATAQRAQADAARQTEREMRSLAGANNAAAQSMRRATGNMRGLENAFSATFQAGSLFRTMLGSITFGTFIQGVFAAGDALDQFRVTMEVATGSASGALQEMDYVDEIASRLGVNLQAARDNYSKFAISADIAGVAASDTQKIFESVSTAMAVLGKSTADQNLAFMALEQMMSKGTVSSEELRRQLGERLPGAVNMMAQALGVTTAELQELLKAGAIASADALPKFAEVLEKRFGPGLEQASRRAGNNLQKLRNEITKFLEEVAQSGFMQELAAQFRMLTDTLAGGDGVSAARKLGEALANMARIGGEAAKFLIENIDGIGAALKAIGIGIVVRQLGLMGAAVATGAQQMAGYTAAWMSNTKAVTAANAATVKHSAALTGNTAALARNSTAAKASTVATVDLARKQEIAARKALTARRSFVGMTGAMSAIGAAAGSAAAGAGALARGLSVIAPVAGIAVTALLLIPGAMDMIGLGADNMETKVNAALARAGVAFDEYGETTRKTASQAELTRLINDMQTLEQAARNMSGVEGAWSAMFGLKEFDSILLAMDNIRGEAGGFNQTMENMARRFSGLETLDIEGMSSGAKAAAEDLFDDIFEDFITGQGDAIAMQEKLNAAMLRFPSGSEVFGVFDDLIQRQLRLEPGVANTADSMTRLYGSEQEKIALEFAEAAKQVIRTGENIDELRTKQETLAQTYPEMAGHLQQMREEFDRAFARGESPLELQRTLQSFYGDTANEIMRLRDEVERTEQAVGEASTRMMDGLQESLGALREIDLNEGFGFTGISEDVLIQYEALFNKFNEFQSSGGLQLSAEAVQNFANTLQTASPAAAQFKEALISQFAALSQSEQTYTRLDSIMLRLKSRYPEARAEIDQMSQAILQNARGSDTAAMSYTDLARAVASLPWPTEEARQAAMEMMGLASNTQAAGNAADAAAGGLYAAADGTDAVASGAAGATAQVRALQAALASLGAVAAGVQSAAAQIVDDINFQAQQKAAPIWERAMNDFRREQEAVINEAFEAALAEMPEGDRAGGPLYQAALADRNAAMAELDAGAQEILAASRNLYNTEAWRPPSSGGGGRRRPSGRGGGGGGSRASGMAAEQSAAEKLNETLKERITSLEKERVELQLVASGQFETAEGARLMAEAMMAGNGAVDQQTAAMIRQIDAAAKLNEELRKVATDPVKEWMDSVPNWIEAGQQIEMGAINHLKGALSEFIKTGKFDIEALGEAILGTIADIVADKAVAELMNLFGRDEGGGLGGLLGGLFGSQGDEMTGPTMGQGQQVAQGGVQAGNSISQAMIQAGQQVSQNISQAMMQGGQQTGQQVQMAHMHGGQQAAQQTRLAGMQHSQQVRSATMLSGNQHATEVRTAIQSAGQQHAQAVGMAAGGGGGLGGMFSGGSLLNMGLSLLGGMFSEGGYSTNAVAHTPVPAAAFRNAPHFSEGTTNTSGIPAVLHPNEAVVPLSKGRKIPVDLGDGAGGGSGGSKTVNQTFNISTPDADSFRKSQKQIAADGASAAQRALESNR